LRVAAPKNPGGNAGKGRIKGVPNKLTSDVKAMILGALHAAGGQRWLEEQMAANPAAFMTLLGKILPTQVNATIKTDVVELTDAELLAIACVAATSGNGADSEADSAQEPRQVDHRRPG
jgi:hypothetical protein